MNRGAGPALLAVCLALPWAAAADPAVGPPADSLECAQALARSRPTVEELLQQSECLVRADRLEDAAAVLLQVCRQAPPAAYQARLRWAELRYFRGDLAGAGARLDSLLEENPRHELANDALSLLLLLDEFASQSGALATLARAQLRERQGRVEEARAEWTRLGTEGSPPLRQLGLVLQARLAHGRGRPEAAMDLYGRALAQDPQGPYALDAQLGRAGLLAESGDVAAALQAYEAVLRQYPEDPRAPRTRLEIQRLRRLAPARRDE